MGMTKKALSKGLIYKLIRKHTQNAVTCKN